MEPLLELSCPNCSSELNYDADKSKLKCLHCGGVLAIENKNERIGELSYDAAPLHEAEKEPGLVNYTCSKCGKGNTASGNTVFFECTNCGNNVINTQAYRQRAVYPSSILPFAISKSRALDIFKQWIGKGFWTESALKHLSLADTLEGHYIPFWTFDVHTVNEWSGQAGYHYFETEEYTDSQGKTQSRAVTRTRWEYHSGILEHFFNDILICGNKAIAEQTIEGIYPYRLEELVPMNEQYIAGWNAENYSRNITDSFAVAQEYIKADVRSMCSQELGGDTQMGLSVDTTLHERTYKHIVLPVWLCEYLYKGKKYGFIINGQTGKIDGKKPLSAAKITVAIIVAVLLVLLLYYASQQ